MLMDDLVTQGAKAYDGMVYTLIIFFSMNIQCPTERVNLASESKFSWTPNYNTSFQSL